MNMKKRALSLLLVLVMAVSMVPVAAVTAWAQDAATATVDFTVQAYSYYLCPPQFGVSVSADLAESYGYTDTVQDGVSALDVLVKAHEIAFEEEFTRETAQEILAVSDTGWVQKIFSFIEGGFSFAINGEYPYDPSISYNDKFGYTGYVINQAPVKSGDTVEFLCCQDSSYYMDYYTWFEQDGSRVSAVAAATGTPLTLNLQGYIYAYGGAFVGQDRVNNGMLGAITDAQITFVDIDTGDIYDFDGAVTDEDGNVSLTFDEAGTYYISAYTDYDQYIFLPWLKVEVTGDSITPTGEPKLTALEFYNHDLDTGLLPTFNADVQEGYTVTSKAGKTSISIKVAAPKGCTVTANYAGKSKTLTTGEWGSLDGLENKTAHVPVELVVQNEASGQSAIYKLTLICTADGGDGGTTMPPESGTDKPQINLLGSGTAEDPYRLQTADDLTLLDETVEGGETFADKHFALTADITLDSGWDGIGHANIERGSKTPTTKEFKPFAGHFDGGGYTLTFAGSQPLFDCVRTATIENLKIKGNIADDGLIANYAEDKLYPAYTAEISGVTVLSGTQIAGSGLLGGYASGTNVVTITDCHIESGVTIGSADASNIGGIAGDFNGTISNSTCAATVIGKDFVGGIVAGQGQSKSDTLVEGCTFSGQVTASGSYVGGIAGAGYTGTGWGIASGPNAGCIDIRGCTVTGSVAGGDYVGGILGAEPGVVQCWEDGAGEVSGNRFTGTISSNGSYVGGVIGYMKSMNKNNVISGNSYKASETVTKGIGGAAYVDTNYANPTAVDAVIYVNSENGKTGISGMTLTAQNRTDDPLGKDAEKLARVITAGEKSLQGIRLEALPRKTEYLAGEALATAGMKVTALWSDGSTEDVTAAASVSGYDSGKIGTQTLRVSYRGVTATFTVTVKAAGEITVYFSLLGDTKHSAAAGNHTLANGGLTTWISRAAYTVDANATVLDVFKKAVDGRYSYTNASGGYITQVNGLGEMDNGPKSGWMFTLNGAYPDYGISDQHLKNGDVIVFHYTDDYPSEDHGFRQEEEEKPAEEAPIAGETLPEILNVHRDTADYLASLGTPQVGSVGGEWLVVGLVRSGREVDAAYYDSVVSYIAENIDENSRLHGAKSTENARLILMLTAIGKDATDVDGFDLISGLNSMDYICKQGINGPVWTLIALDSGNYPAPTQGDVTREALVRTILDARTTDGGWALDGDRADPDMTAMALQALSPYYRRAKAAGMSAAGADAVVEFMRFTGDAAGAQPLTAATPETEIARTVEEGVAALSAMQNSDGTFTGIDGTTSESVSQVIVALSALGIDAHTDERFVKNGVSAVDALMAYATDEGGFSHVKGGPVNGMASEQAYAALTAYARFQAGKTGLYDMTDILDKGGDTAGAPAVDEPAPVPGEEKAGATALWWIIPAAAVVLGGGAAVAVRARRKEQE